MQVKLLGVVEEIELPKVLYLSGGKQDRNFVFSPLWHVGTLPKEEASLSLLANHRHFFNCLPPALGVRSLDKYIVKHFLSMIQSPLRAGDPMIVERRRKSPRQVKAPSICAKNNWKVRSLDLS